MQNLLSEFENNGRLLELESRVYSGECRHIGGGLNPETSHHAVILIDRHPTSERYYFSTIFSYFYEENPFSGWSVAEARENMNSYWLENGILLRGQLSTRVEIYQEDQVSIANIYWMRQNPQTKSLYYITYAGPGLLTSFCELQAHKN